MAARSLSAVSLATILAFTIPSLASAGELRLVFNNGRVTLMARDVPLQDILVEWERVGGTRIVNRDRVPATRVTLEFPNVTEEQALETLLRPIAGYMASRRLDRAGGASAFSRIILLPAPASAAAYPSPGAAVGSSGGPPSGPPLGRPGMQRRVLPDGRVVTIVEDSQGAGDQDEPGEAPRDGAPGMMRPPFNAPPRQEGQTGDDAPQQVLQPGQARPTTTSAPAMPATVGTPGAVAAKPGPTPPPIKPPGD